MLYSHLEQLQYINEYQLICFMFSIYPFIQILNSRVEQLQEWSRDVCPDNPLIKSNLALKYSSLGFKIWVLDWVYHFLLGDLSHSREYDLNWHYHILKTNTFLGGFRVHQWPVFLVNPALMVSEIHVS